MRRMPTTTRSTVADKVLGVSRRAFQEASTGAPRLSLVTRGKADMNPSGLEGDPLFNSRPVRPRSAEFYSRMGMVQMLFRSINVADLVTVRSGGVEATMIVQLTTSIKGKQSLNLVARTRARLTVEAESVALGRTGLRLERRFVPAMSPNMPMDLSRMVDGYLRASQVMRGRGVGPTLEQATRACREFLSNCGPLLTEVRNRNPEWNHQEIGTDLAYAFHGVNTFSLRNLGSHSGTLYRAASVSRTR